MKAPTPEDASPASARKRVKTRPAARRRTTENTYSDPALRERLKVDIRAGSKGGDPGTWSARKSQLLTLAYQKAGGGYLQAHPNSKQRSLHQWSEQDWQTADGGPARRAGGTSRYLPAAAWDALTPEQQKATNAKKRAASKAGQRLVHNTAAARQARKEAK